MGLNDIFAGHFKKYQKYNKYMMVLCFQWKKYTYISNFLCEIISFFAIDVIYSYLMQSLRFL
jgi:hypothetical protein